MRKGRNGTKERINTWVAEEIKAAATRGIMVQVDGIYYDNGNLEKLPLLKEKESYMRDYIGDERGRITEIIFDIIKI